MQLNGLTNKFVVWMGLYGYLNRYVAKLLRVVIQGLFIHASWSGFLCLEVLYSRKINMVGLLKV